MVESVNADASSYDVGSSASMKKILGKYLFGGCVNLSNRLGRTGLVASGVWVRWSRAETFGYAKSVGADSVLDDSTIHEADLVL